MAKQKSELPHPQAVPLEENFDGTRPFEAH